jgi:hypothetical protein
MINDRGPKLNFWKLGWRWPISPRFIPLALDPNITAGRGLKICLSEVLLALKEDAEGWGRKTILSVAVALLVEIALGAGP